MNIISFTAPVTGNFLVDIIRWLIQISSSIAVGVILFTVILKLITLPFDFFSRVSMRKNSLKMEQMRPELEKLQKQYANDKTLYNQKMMALYKKNGYSMWGSCLPTIITLVIFIVAINAFTAYSEFQNREYFYNMSKSYNSVIYEGLERDDNYIKVSGNTYKIDYKGIYEEFDANKMDASGEPDEIISTSEVTEEEVTTVTTILADMKYNAKFQSGDVVFIVSDYDIVKTVTVGSEEPSSEITNKQISVKTENGYIEHRFYYSLNDQNEFVLGTAETFKGIKEKVSSSSPIASSKNNNLKVKVKYYEPVDGKEVAKYKEVEYVGNPSSSDIAEYYGYYGLKKLEYVRNYNIAVDKNKDIPKEEKADHYIDLDNPSTITPAIEKAMEEYVSVENFIREICQEKSAEAFRNIDMEFLWIKNIWVTDSPMSHPISASWNEFKSTYKYTGGNKDKMTANAYNELVAKLGAEKSAPNGYFILVALTAGISFLTQFVMSKSQKSQMELQTVDGQGAKTQKMMMWIMPIMMAVFAFMYTAAFSIYMVISSVFSILTTLGINWIVDVSFARKNKKNSDDNTIRGRVHNVETVDPKEEKARLKAEKKKAKAEKAKKDKKSANKNDFIDSKTDKHIRGRLK